MNEKMFSQNENALPQAEKTNVQKPFEGTDYSDLLEKYTINPSDTSESKEPTEPTNDFELDGMERRLEELNKAVENASPEEKEEKIQELLEWEKQLDMIQEGLGVNKEIADVALSEVYNETLPIPEVLEELAEENPEFEEILAQGDEEEAKGFLMSLAKTLKGSKLAKTVGLWTAITIGGMSILGHANDAEGANLQTKTMYSKENVLTSHPMAAKVNMGSLVLKINSNQNIDPATKLIFTNILNKNSSSDKAASFKSLGNMKLVDYVSSGKLTDKEIETVLQIAESI